MQRTSSGSLNRAKLPINPKEINYNSSNRILTLPLNILRILQFDKLTGLPVLEWKMCMYLAKVLFSYGIINVAPLNLTPQISRTYSLNLWCFELLRVNESTNPLTETLFLVFWHFNHWSHHMSVTSARKWFHAVSLSVALLLVMLMIKGSTDFLFLLRREPLEPWRKNN